MSKCGGIPKTGKFLMYFISMRNLVTTEREKQFCHLLRKIKSLQLVFIVSSDYCKKVNLSELLSLLNTISKEVGKNYHITSDRSNFI